MNKKVKLKGRLNMYMRWPVLLSGTAAGGNSADVSG